MASVTLGQHPVVSPVSQQQHHNISGESESRESFFLRKLLRKPSREKMMLTRGSSSLDGESARSPIIVPISAAAASSSLSCSQPLITGNGEGEGGGGPLLDSRYYGCTNGSLQLQQTPRSSSSSSTDNDNAAVAAAEDNGNLLENGRARCQDSSMLVAAANGSQFGPTGGLILMNTNRDVTATETQESRKEQQSVVNRTGEGEGEQLPCPAAETGGGTGGRRSSLKGTKCSSSSSRTSACANGHLGSGRRLSRKFKSLSTGTPTRGLDLDRVTQGRSGIVRIMRTEPARREAWSIFGPLGSDPRVKAERGEGHLFVPKPVAHDWCDACSRQISAAGALQCKYCSYTCHLECQGLVQLDCNQGDCNQGNSQSQPRPALPLTSPQQPHSATPTQETTNAAPEEEERRKVLSAEELSVMIEEYNAKASDTEQGMKLASDGSYTGFIKVHLRLRRPVTVCDPPGGPEEGGANEVDTATAAEGAGSSPSRTSFYLPSDAVKQLHVGSTTTVAEVIKGLLKKYTVLDNPRKFALYRQTHRDGQDLFQKLAGSEHPLYLRLVAGPDPEQLTFILKENETGDVEWHAFSLPELQNFLTILEKEERERVRLVEQRYGAYKHKLSQALKDAQA